MGPDQRKVIQIETYKDHRETLYLFVLCDDGSMWTRKDYRGEWVEVDGVPQP